ncbi:hypothetical protein AAFC00_001334 [Neodothiora populina]|uniref:Myb-like domain-containing protein n=1 Tax=Neodothiora populina TaxID=2781224 RepID=A0ABR3PNJ3_9PEZI
MPPKEGRVTVAHRQPSVEANQSQSGTPAQAQPGHRNAAMWTDADDRILLSARASGLNWQPIATRHFPSKSANACRKRHERLMERRSNDDWDSHRLEMLATQYMECRREMWGVLASRVGERWALVEAKCMEKGFKNLQALARAAAKKRVARDRAQQRGNEEEHHEGDSGIGVSDEDAEMEVGVDSHAVAVAGPSQRTLQPILPANLRPDRPLLPTLPLYQPPATFQSGGPDPSRLQTDHSAHDPSQGGEQQSRTPEEGVQRGVSIRSMLSGPEGGPDP